MRASKGLLGLVAASFALGGCSVADVRPGVVRHMTPKQIRAQFHGPEVSIRSKVVMDARSRRIQPVVSLKDSAYILVGDIGDDGTLRILYPARPGITNLVKGAGSFETPAFQPRVVKPWLASTFQLDRTAPGYSFVIASRSPLDLSKLSEDSTRWSVFDVYYENFLDPKPAITDLAASIATNVGDVSISYSPYSSGAIGPVSSSGRPAVSPEAARMGPGGRRRPPVPPG